ncbi:acetylornithine and succinylornithine aminotransferase [Ruminiclostridium papyrosolvens DSM 2782]|uniref:Acetylornithine aminotransferase n=1 Tax=Ruminiclostridium papyrosolvens DSM 2782 TaxID=588581 RepID=F1TGT1_9FIRM|nr:aspartate aminotransferase family protein [Ruminiclostridium papyrosolvens]EGD46412.1 acetylornithine and succinylornithine aminotransferase [Ruminiclostridium papyrosolvens DSM 2782]WES33975.1 aspartate aminotransferase family protein [Ruminiclostridium papyrosolvens DSM 2782]
MNLEKIQEYDDKYYMNTFGKRIPVAFKKGKGIHLWSTEDEKYTDFFAGIAVNSIGYGHPIFTEMVSEQLNNLVHCSNLYYIEPQAQLAKELVENSCADKIFFSNSGAEANEGAIKLARIYFKKQGMPEKYEIITLHKSFHGRTITTLSATGQEKYAKPFEPLTKGFKKVPQNDIAALEAAITENTCAIMLEPVQGESGVYPCDPEYMKKVRELCNDKNLLLIFDEVQTGVGRTGKLFGYQNFDIEPDIFTLAKALGGGIPIAAVCAKESVAKAFTPGDHGSTFGGNPLACTAGLAVMKIMKDEKLPENAEKIGSYIKNELEKMASGSYSIISEIRSAGLMVGIELNKAIAPDIKNKMFEKKYLIANIGQNILRILPPLIITQKDADDFITALKESLEELN